VIAVLLGAAQVGAQSASPGAATIVYHFDRPGLPVPSYTFTVHEDGSGTFHATLEPLRAEGMGVAPAPATETTVPIILTAGTTAKLFEEVRGTDHFRNRCESKAKNVADTGSKTIDYDGPDGHASCTFNYTENKALKSITETFAAITETLEFGRRMEYDHRYDRLGLDAEMTLLVAAVKDKSALEVQTIAPTLKSIAMDGAVIERVRVAAGKLLQMAESNR
jgi:hypothetical protein